ncbi:hypothetical protein EDD21DRAFT_385479 [Dissophora ornata]|nr:hypothetical protein BGZ58_010152 [Dissophora ornata]KAI8597429.1 hypothetical protein EDD21DRAFT_385479 [Dissophora ornata]
MDNNNISSGVLIYVVLLVGLLVGFVYFGRVCIAKRRLLRDSKNPDFEACPPKYLQHLEDLQVVITRPRTVPATTTTPSSSPNRSSSPSAPAAALVRGEGYYIVTPRTHALSRTPSAGSAASGRSLTVVSPKLPQPSLSSTQQGAGGQQPHLPSYEELSPRQA